MWQPALALKAGQTLVLDGQGAHLSTPAEARAAGLLDVDLSDEWAPYIFSDSDPPANSDAGPQPTKPNAYRATFVALANDRLHPDDATGPTRALDMSPEAISKRAEADRTGRKLVAEPPKRPRADLVRNFLEPFGIPPTLSVLAKRLEDDANKSCFAELDVAPLRAYAAFKESLPYLSRERARKDFETTLSDAAWLDKETAARSADAGTGAKEAALDELAADPKTKARVDRARRGQARVAAVRAAQARLACEGLLLARSRAAEGVFDLPTHEALAQWERKNDIFGWGFLEGETLDLLQRPPGQMHMEAFRRVLTERLSDAAAVLEDGSANSTYTDESGASHPVPNLLAAHVDGLLAALHLTNEADVNAFLRGLAQAKVLPHLHVAFPAPPKPPYYQPNKDGDLEIEAEIDRGDVWYDFPWDSKGKPIEQLRTRYPSLTVFVKWNKQRIPLARWRTTIGSWRSEMHPDGHIYYKYKNSDVGPRIWRQIVASPVWIPPDSTPAKDLLTRKTLDIRTGPETVVNTDVMGPGFQSAYGLVMAIHHQKQTGGGLFDNQIRTHGSVDYTSIARRFSHGCHRVVNARAVRLFDFILRHRRFTRMGDSPLKVRRSFVVDNARYGFEMNTRGYYYQLVRPIPVDVLEGRVKGSVKHPVATYVRKPGVDYGPAEDDPATSDASASTATPTPPPIGPETPSNENIAPQ